MATVQIIFEGQDKNFTANVQKIQKEMDGLSSKLKQAGVSSAAYNKAIAEQSKTNVGALQSVKNFASANAGLITVLGGVATGAIAVGKAIYVSAKAWEEGAKIGAKLEAILKSTGNAAGQTVSGLDSMANALAKVNGLDDELVKNGEALLLTFTKIKGEAFEPTMQAAIDMAAVLGGDLNGSVIQVGKAMNDFSGYTALKRAGVSFTEEQIKQINHFKETNNLVGYQNLLLNELQTEFGGAAKAMTEAGLGGEAVALAWGNMTEEIGRSNAEWIQDFNRGLAYSFESLTGWIKNMNDAAEGSERNTQAQNDLKTAYEKTGGVVWEQVGRGKSLTKGYQEYAQAAIQAAHRADEWASAGQNVNEVMKEQAVDLEAISSANANLINDAINIQKTNDSYQESQQEILDTITELQAKKETMHKSEKDEIAKINEQINEQKEKYKEGAEAFGEAQAEKLTMLALEKIAMQDGVAGYSEAEAAKAKLLLDTANIAEESAFRQVLAFDQAASAIANGTMAADELNKLLTMMSEHGWSIDVAVNVQKSIDIGSGVGTQTAGQQGAGWQGGMWRGGKGGRGAGIPWLASGGSSGAAVVGDRQGGGWVDGVSELVFGNFTVVPSGKSKKMLQSGALGKVPSFAFGGEFKDSGSGQDSTRIVTPPYIPTSASMPSVRGGGSSDAVSSAMQFIETQAVDMQASAQNSVAQMAQISQQMTQSILNSNAQNQVILEDIAAILRHENPRAVGKAVAYEVAKGS